MCPLPWGGRPLWAGPVASARRLFATRRESKQLAATITRIPHGHAAICYECPQTKPVKAEFRADCPVHSFAQKTITSEVQPFSATISLCRETCQRLD